MKLQLLSDLHLETELFEASPAAGAEVLVVAGDVDSSWTGLAQFRDWPVPVLFVAGNHEFDRREIAQAWPLLRERCARLGIRLLECETAVLTAGNGERIRFVGTTRWSDFDLFGASERERSMRAGRYFAKIMKSTDHGAPFDAAAVREVALECRAWLAQELHRPRGSWDRTVVVTHFAPSLRSADPRYGCQPGTASFCNADDDLLACADLWLHGHLHCSQDYRVEHASGSTRVVCNPRGHAQKGEPVRFQPQLLLEL